MGSFKESVVALRYPVATVRESVGALRYPVGSFRESVGALRYPGDLSSGAGSQPFFFQEGWGFGKLRISVRLP